MCKYVLPFIALFGAAGALFAGEATISGSGKVAAKPDYVTLDITVTSECFAIAGEATKANDAAVKKIYDFLMGLTDNSEGSKDQVLTSGGYTQPFSHTIHFDNQAIVECQRTFKKSNTVTLKFSQVDQFGSVFDDIQEMVYAEQNEDGNESDQPRTYVTVGSANPGLFHSTRLALEDKAIEMASSDALRRFAAAQPKDCEITKTDIVGIDLNTGSHSMYENTHAAPRMGGDVNVPIAFDDQWVNMYVTLKIGFKGGHCKKPEPAKKK